MAKENRAAILLVLSLMAFATFAGDRKSSAPPKPAATVAAPVKVTSVEGITEYRLANYAFADDTPEGPWRRRAESPTFQRARQTAVVFGDPRRADKPEPTVDLIVEFRQPAASNVRADWKRDLEAEIEGAQVRRTFSQVFRGASVRVKRESVNTVKQLPYVASVHLARRFETMSDGAMSARAANARIRSTNSRGGGITVAVIDSGIDYTHSALGGGFGPGFKVAGGWDFANDDADPMDDLGHGTHVAGIIAADGAGLLGVAPDVSLIAYKVIGTAGFAEEEDIIAAIERAMDPDQNGDTSDHVDVVNMSLGGPASENDAVVNAVERATATGIVFSIAMGNSGLFGDVPSPALAPSAISVGAIWNDNRVASFTTRGPTWEYAIKPEVVAPGVLINSTIPNDKTAEASGTSMAAPHVAGIVALVKAQHPEWTPAEIKSAIVTSARWLEEDPMTVGAGRADANAAATATALVLPTAVNFGRDDTTQAVWTTSRTITLRNITNIAQTLAPAIRGQRDGVVVTLTPEVVNLAPGESKTVAVALRVTNGLVPKPKEGSLSFGGRIEWSGGAAPIHVPWAFVKGGFVTIENADGGLALASVLGSRKYTTDEFLDRTRVFWPLENVDVALMQFTLPAPVAIVENVDVEGAALARASFDAAQLHVALSTTDEKGFPLESRNIECQERIVLAFPNGQKINFAASPDYRPRFTPFSDRIKAYLAHTCGDPDTTTLYFAMHEPIKGLRADSISTSSPHYLQQEVRFTPDIAKDESQIAALAMMRFPGPNDTWFAEGGWFFLMRQVTSNLKILFTKTPGPEVDIAAIVDWWGRCWNDDLGHPIDCPVVDNIYLYLNEQTVSAETDMFLDVSPMAYQVPLGEPITFGRAAPPTPRVIFANGTQSWGMVAEWMGPLGERIFDDTIHGEVALYDANGATVAKGLTGLLREEPLPKGRYRVEAIDRRPVIGSIRGTATYNAWVDTNKSDALLPLFTGLRVVDEHERQVSRVVRNAPASLLFSVADLIRDRVFFERVPLAEEKTRVEYRAHQGVGAANWKPLPALVSARQYAFSTFLPGGVGSIYRVDLGAVTSVINGPVDFRITVEDKAGNTAEVTLEPAMWVGETVRRRAAAH